MVLILILILALTKTKTPKSLSRNRAQNSIKAVKNTTQAQYVLVFTKGLAAYNCPDELNKLGLKAKRYI